MKVKYFEGLNALRFFAASLVVLDHAYQSSVLLNVVPMVNFPLLRQGVEAVSFFFTLSGFLITYLLIRELEMSPRPQSVNIRDFYKRRVVRIWPVYFLVLFFDFFLLGYVYPKLRGHVFFDFPSLGTGLALYLFFLPNFAATHFNVGLLYPLWSIGIEEQFYLAFAPFFQFCRKRVALMIGTVLSLSVLLALANQLKLFSVDTATVHFLSTMKFHCLAMGGLFAYILHYRHDLINSFGIESRAFQLLSLALILAHLMGGLVIGPEFFDDLIMSVVYSTLLINVSVNPRRIVNLEFEPLVYLGQISYGIYMYHMWVNNFMSLVIQKWFHMMTGWAFFAAYFVVSLLLTVSISAFSYRFFEQPIMRWGRKQKTARLKAA